MHEDLGPAEAELAEVRARIRRLIDRRTCGGWVADEEALFGQLCQAEEKLLYEAGAKRALKCRKARGASTMR
ncbi:MAG: hypothetical protein JWO37_2085 [Acidimicrobiales bacterium]|jgi:hypothetical protein|nr:hypothetical protein [Acidimicrobiales bacterium]